MKQHLSTSKPKAYSHYQAASVLSQGECTPAPVTVESKSEIKDLKRQIADLQLQLTQLTQKSSRRDTAKPNHKPTAPKLPDDNLRPQKFQPCSRNMNNSPVNRPKPWYCFRCGEDGHIKPQCESEPNSTLVALKRKQLKEKQTMWDIKNGTSTEATLN